MTLIIFGAFLTLCFGRMSALSEDCRVAACNASTEEANVCRFVDDNSLLQKSSAPCIEDELTVPEYIRALERVKMGEDSSRSPTN